MVLAPGNRSLHIVKPFITRFSFCNYVFTSYSKGVSYFTQGYEFIIEKFDDIKFGKVLTKLYARLYTMEQIKYLPPKYSFAMKDLAEYLGIFEITED